MAARCCYYLLQKCHWFLTISLVYIGKGRDILSRIWQFSANRANIAISFGKSLNVKVTCVPSTSSSEVRLHIVLHYCKRFCIAVSSRCVKTVSTGGNALSNIQNLFRKEHALFCQVGSHRRRMLTGRCHLFLQAISLLSWRLFFVCKYHFASLGINSLQSNSQKIPLWQNKVSQHQTDWYVLYVFCMEKV